MAGNNIKGITVEIGGDTTPLNDALKGTNKVISNTQSELREVNKQLKFDPTNTELLKQKQTLLAKEITNTKEKLGTLKDAERQARAQFKKGTVSEEQYRALQREVIKTESQLKTLSKQAVDTNLAIGKIKDAADKLGKGAGAISSAMTPVTLAVVGAGAAAVKMGSDYVESLNKVDVAFKKDAKGVEAWSKTTLEQYGIAGGTALDMASLFGDMGTSMGFPTDKAAGMSEKLVGLAGDLASFKNIGLDEASTALKSIFTGETESLKNLGIVMTDNNLQNFASSKGIKTKTADMTESEKVQLRYNFVMDKTKNAQGDYARTADGTANSTRTLTERVKELSADIGQQLLPIITPIIQYVSNLIKQFSQLDSGTKQIILVILGVVAAIAPLAKIIQGGAFLIGGIATVISTVTAAIAVAGGTAVAATPGVATLASAFTLLAGPVGIVIAIIAAVVVAFVVLWNNCEGFRNFWIGLWASLQMTFQAALAAIQQAFATVWNYIGPTIMNGLQAIQSFWNSVWPQIQQIFSSVWEAMKAILAPAIALIDLTIRVALAALQSVWGIVWNGIKNVFKLVWDLIVGIVKTAWGLISGAIKLGLDTVTGIFQIFKDLFSGNWSALWNDIKSLFSNIWNDIVGIFTGIIANIGGLFGGLATDALQWGKDIIMGIVDGIKSAASKVGDAVKGVAQDIRKFLHFSTPDEGPLADFDTYMPDMMESLARGMTDNISKVRAAAQKVAASMTAAIPTSFDTSVQLNSAVTATRGVSVASAASAGGIASTTAKQTGSAPVFNQVNNNYSPKALNHSEIARQTRNDARQLVAAMQRG